MGSHLAARAPTGHFLHTSQGGLCCQLYPPRYCGRKARSWREREASREASREEADRFSDGRDRWRPRGESASDRNVSLCRSFSRRTNQSCSSPPCISSSREGRLGATSLLRRFERGTVCEAAPRTDNVLLRGAKGPVFAPISLNGDGSPVGRVGLVRRKKQSSPQWCNFAAQL